MDNFRKSKRLNNTGSVDGMMRQRMRRGTVPGARDNHKSSVFSKGEASKSLTENFNQKEGFIARKTKPIVPDGKSLGRQPQSVRKPLNMNIDDKPKRTKKARGFKPNRRWFKNALRGFAGLFVILFVIGGYLGLKGYLRAREVFKGGGDSIAWECKPDVGGLKKEGDGRVNFLLLGKGGPEQTDGPNLTDTIIVASVDPCSKEAGLLSIPRDLAVKMESGETQKINAVYALTKMSAENRGKSEAEAEKAGIEAMEKVVQDVVGIKMNYYTMIDFSAFEKAINAVGGIDIDVQKPIYEKMKLHNKVYTLDVGTGNQHFDGLRALAYSRCRHCDNRGDFGRSDRQREVIIAMRRKIISLGTFSNPVKMSQLIDSFGDRVTTNLSVPDDVMRLYGIGQAIGDSEIKSISLVDEPNVLIGSGSSSLGLGSIQVPKAGIYRYDAIQSYVRTTFRDGLLARENAGLVVMNGTSQGGLAKKHEGILKGYGYNVLSVADAPSKDYSSTVIVDLKKKDNVYTRRYLELRYGVTAVTALPEGIILPENNPDFVIIVGKNEASNR